MKYITVQDAAIQLGVCKQAIYQAIWRKSLKAKKDGKRTFTTQEWIDEYTEYWRSKQEHSLFNGEKVFDKDRGHFSVEMLAKEFNVKPQMIYDMIKEGKIKHFRKGNYIIISREEVDRMKENIIERHCKSA